MTNWIGRENPYGLLKPPTWFLRQLWERDHALVILPGKTECVYRLARRVKGIGLQHAALGHDSETARMVQHRLVPVTSLVPWVQWGAPLFQWLDRQDTWNQGGTEKVIRKVEDAEQDVGAKLRRETADDNDAVSHSAWHSLLMRTGQRVFVHQPTAAA